jgi:hypothetical protein
MDAGESPEVVTSAAYPHHGPGPEQTAMVQFLLGKVIREDNAVGSVYGREVAAARAIGPDALLEHDAIVVHEHRGVAVQQLERCSSRIAKPELGIGVGVHVNKQQQEDKRGQFHERPV